MTTAPTPAVAEAAGATPAGTTSATGEPTPRVPVLGLAVVGALMIAMSGPFVALSGASPVTSAGFRCLYALPVLALVAWLETRRHGRRALASRRAGALAGLCFSADLFLWHSAIDAVGAGLATVLANVQVVVVGVVAWLVHGERPERRTVLALPVVLLGVALIAGVGGSAYGEAPVLGAFLGLGTAFAYTGFILLLREGGREKRRPAGPLADATAVAAVCLVVLGLAFGSFDPVPSWPSHGWLLLLALSSQVVAWLLISATLPRLPALATAVVLLLQPVGSVLVGVTLLDERPTAVQLAGVGLVLVGVVVAQSRTGRRDRGAREPAVEPTPAPGVPAGTPDTSAART